MIHQTLSGPLLKEAGLPTNEDVRTINSLKNPPPVPVSERDIYIRRCRLAGDATDAYHGRFRTGDLPKLLSMVQGAPLLVGHNKRSLGVARFFGGTIEDQEDNKYIVPCFYWLRGHSSSEDLRVAIDGGLYNEASISFAYQTPTCSVCGKDIRGCDHLPGRKAVRLSRALTRSPENDDSVFYYYDNVVAVLEGSLVYRGAQPGTGFSLSDEDFISDGRGSSSVLRSESIDEQNPNWGIPTLRVKRHGQWYRAPLVKEDNPPTMPLSKENS